MLYVRSDIAERIRRRDPGRGPRHPNHLSAAQFGEGSFDTGIIIPIPLDVFFDEPSRDYASYVAAFAGIIRHVRSGRQRLANRNCTLASFQNRTAAIH
jgi:hypothetical protein